MVFGVGVVGLALFLRGRGVAALVITAVAGTLLHSTTAALFLACIGVGMLWTRPAARAPVVGAIVLAAVVACVAAARPLGWPDAMDAQWASVLANKDYIFPTEWPLHAWAINLASAVIVVCVHLLRRRAGLADVRETGLVVGCLALVVGLLALLPALSARVAFAVQLQPPRVFWIADFLATASFVWLAVESGRPPPRALAWRGATVVAVLLLFSVGRGTYILRVERSGEPLVRVGLPETPWTDVCRWARDTAVEAHFVADPGHLWKYGSSFRVGAARDVLLEEVKDTAISMYSRDAAYRTLARIADLSEFDRLTAPDLRALAGKYDLDFLVSERSLELPVAYRNDRFIVYHLK
jgi:hypothetical protein